MLKKVNEAGLKESNDVTAILQVAATVINSACSHSDGGGVVCGGRGLQPVCAGMHLEAKEEVGNRKKNLTGHPLGFQNEAALYAFFSRTLAHDFRFLFYLSIQTGQTNSNRTTSLFSQTHYALSDRGERTSQLSGIPDLFQ